MLNISHLTSLRYKLMPAKLAVLKLLKLELKDESAAKSKVILLYLKSLIKVTDLFAALPKFML